MKKASYPELAQSLAAADSFLILSHPAPDGDAVGSMLCMYHLLRSLGKERIVLMNDDPVPKIYQWLPGAELLVLSKPIDGPVDIVIVLDAAQKSRLGKAASAIPASAQILVLDHHPDNGSDGDLGIADPSYCAVGEMLVELAEAGAIPVTQEAAVCAYVSIVTDTGGFRFSNTTARALRATAALVDTGIDVSGVSRRVFETMSLPKAALLAKALQRVERHCNGRVTTSVLTKQDAAEAAARLEDYDGIVNFVLSIEGADVGILFRETEDGQTKVSVRSRGPLNSSELLKKFGGGGHAAASGATLDMPMTEARRAIMDQIALMGIEGV